MQFASVGCCQLLGAAIPLPEGRRLPLGRVCLVSATRPAAQDDHAAAHRAQERRARALCGRPAGDAARGQPVARPAPRAALPGRLVRARGRQGGGPALVQPVTGSGVGSLARRVHATAVPAASLAQTLVSKGAMTSCAPRTVAGRHGPPSGRLLTSTRAARRRAGATTPRPSARRRGTWPACACCRWSRAARCCAGASRPG